MSINNNYTAEVGIKFNDARLQSQLKSLASKTIEVNAKLSGGTSTQINSINKALLKMKETTVGTVSEINNLDSKTTVSLRNVNKSINTTSETLKTASKHTKTLGQDFVSTMGKVAKFGAITAIFGLVTTAIGNAVKSVKELDSAMVEFKKVSSLSGSGLDNYTKKLGELGLEVARTKEEMVEASTEFVKAGYTEEESAKLAKTASLFQNIADTELSASEASTVLISNMKAFGMTSADSERVVDVINEVSNVFAVSSSDISAGLSKTASAMSTLGNTYEQSIALMVGAGEQMPNQSGKIARGLRSIGLEIVKTAKQTKELETGYGDVTLSLYDQNGALKSTFDIMSELYPTWEKMTNEQKTNLGISLAGKQQYEVFSATMEGFDQVLKANEVGLNAMGSAMKENEAYMDGIEAKTKLLKAQFDLLVNGEGGLNSFIKGVLDGGTALLKFANSDVGGFIIKTTLLTTSLILLNSGLKGLGSALITAGTKAYFSAMGISAQATATALANGATIGFTASLKALGIAFLSSPFGKVALIVAGISALVKVVDRYSVSLKEASESLSENKSIFDETVSTLKTLNDKLEETKDRMNEIENFKAPTLTDKEELNSLKEQNIELERQISLENERQLQASKKLADSASQTLNTKITSSQQIQIGESRDYDGKSTPVYGYSSEKVTPEEELQRSIDMYKKAEQAIIDLNTAYDNGELTLEQYEEQQLGLQQLQDSSRTRALEMVEITNASEQAYKGIIDSKGELTEAEQAEYDRVVLINGQYYIFIDTITNGYGPAIEMATEATEDAKDSLSDYEKALKDLDATLSILSGTTISGLADAFSLLKDAQKEINDTGSLSIDTYESLMNLGAKYQAILFDENGQLRLNEESVTAVYNAKIDEMAITSARNMIDLANTLSSEGKSFADLANDTNSASVAGWEQVAVMMAELELSEKDSKALQVRIDGIKQWAEEAKKSVGTYSETTKAISTQTKAIDKQKEALDKLKDEYKAVTEYIEDQLDSEISRIEDAKSAELDRVDAVIDALNKRKDAELESIDFTIDALDKRKDAELESIDSTIDALNKKRDVEKEYWDNRISALEAQNDATEKQIALEQLQQNLALARNKKVMVMGANGWEIREDEQAVAQAEQDIADYTRKQQAQTEIDILNKLKETALANYTSQIQAQEEFRAQQESNYDSQIQTQEEFRARQEATYDSQIQAQEEFRASQEATYDSQIQVLEGYKTEYNNMVNAYEEEQNRLLALQVLGTDFENQTWQARLANLQSYVDRYNNLQASLSGSVANTSSGSVKTVEKPSSVPTTKKITPAIGRGAITSTVMAYASGVASVPDGGMAITGDNPNNRELVIGSKLNGTATMLSQGSGVVNAQSTKSLAGLLNTLGSSMGLNGQTMGMNTTNQSNATSQSIQIANITLPSVTNGQGLLDELRGFASGMLQTSYSNA